MRPACTVGCTKKHHPSERESSEANGYLTSTTARASHLRSANCSRAGSSPTLPSGAPAKLGNFLQPIHAVRRRRQEGFAAQGGLGEDRVPSALGWIDYDQEHRESMKRVLALFRERESRDELGLGSIRDSIADALFPGTSTIHTRLRYMLFVPWLYQRLEAQKVAAAEIAQKARRIELGLIDPLLEEGQSGVIGRVARQKLKTLPSSIYWAGLASWKILRYPGSQADYHAAFDRIAERRSSGRRREDLDVADEATFTWHAGLPKAPEDFPKAVSFALTREEAEYLRDRICVEHPDSLLAWLARDSGPAPNQSFVWEHPRLASFPAAHRELVRHGQLLAEVMHGAAILYNLELARLRGDRELIDGYRMQLERWVEFIRGPELRDAILDFSMPRLWNLVIDDRHAITAATREFVEIWVEVARAATLDVADSDSSRRLVRDRERMLKRAQSRFDNRVVLQQWSGRSGLLKLSYRWNNARVFLEDLAAGLNAEGG